MKQEDMQNAEDNFFEQPAQPAQPQQPAQGINQNGFNLVVGYNHPVLASARKKSKIGQLVGSLLGVALFTVLLFLLYTVGIAIVVLCGIVIAIFAISAIYCICTLKPNAKNDNNSVIFKFADDYVQIIENNANKGKTKALESCLYSPHSGYKHITAVIEYDEFFKISIHTGYVNGVAKYKNYVLPKDVFTDSDELGIFIFFIQSRTGYRTKFKNKQ